MALRFMERADLFRLGLWFAARRARRLHGVILHFAVSHGDASEQLKGGRPVAALKTMMDRRNLTSLAAVAENAHVLSRLARLG